MRALRLLHHVGDWPLVRHLLRGVEPLSWLTCYAVTGQRESWCARAWRRRRDSWRARWHVRVFGPRHCRAAARWWAK